MAKITIERFIRKLGRQRRITQDILLDAMNRTTRILRRKVVEKHFSNTTAPGLRSVRTQSGKLKKSIRISKAFAVGQGVAADLTIGTKYATTHVARQRRRKKTIRPKKGRYLAIPTGFARNAAGVPIAPPLDPRWAPTKIVKNIIFGQAGGQEVPLFVLKTSVVVLQRISILRDIIAPGEEILKNEILKETKKLL